VLSVRELARPDARVATVIGAGVQGREHLRLLPLVRRFAEIRLASLRFSDAERLARLHPQVRPVADVEAAVRGADVVCLATHAADPVIRPEWIGPGTHVTSVGYHPPGGELPPALARDHRLFVEAGDAFEAPPVGCAELQGLDPAHGTCLGEVLCGRRAGRETPVEITVYKAMGIAMEDLVAANLVHARAQALGVGQRLIL
jgi:ornithine cyclodeaminase/alanine dehydrogenase-like protein (mu-crystallin family)